MGREGWQDAICAPGRAKAVPFVPPAESGWVSVLLSFAVPWGHSQGQN